MSGLRDQRRLAAWAKPKRRQIARSSVLDSALPAAPRAALNRCGKIAETLITLAELDEQRPQFAEGKKLRV